MAKEKVEEKSEATEKKEMQEESHFREYLGI